ncbi:hypothetical protein BCR37DRAFT_403849 [Protomyces lactucae-debilis]|uniref:Ankyrin repeat protein nuc-2 n=1 Tax=Protomyces lactucae-debilis TaxID=2754530 RepID=A0A1Y2EUA3_PROLT|nr:uncharacterized protein BCR37DRAFT_403849 [Protomyces lactucae-debilis]ORY74864.1 hypothetical protein BCR37DRAFT_403849 [Protomyces lactucae-debilis]
MSTERHKLDYKRTRRRSSSSSLQTLIEKKKLIRSSASDDVRSSASFVVLQEGFQQFERDLNKLQQYVELNATGFYKALKKWDKRSKSHTRELYLSRRVEIQPVFNREVLSDLVDTATMALLDLEGFANDEDALMMHPSDTRQPVQNAESDFDSDMLKAVLSDSSDIFREFLTKLTTKSLPNAEARLTRVLMQAMREATDEALTALDEISAVLSSRLFASDVTKIDVYGRTPLHYACLSNAVDDKIVSLLLEHKAPLNALDHNISTPLHYSIIHCRFSTVSLLLQHKAEVNPKNESDYIPLSMACARGHLDIAKLLLDNGAKILYNAEGLQPIHIVARAGHTGFIGLLLENGSDLEARDKFTSEGHVGILKELIACGALTDTRDEDHHSPMYYAAWEGHKAALQALVSAGGAFGNTESTLRRPAAPVAAQVEEEFVDDGIPSLTLPPPILPVRSYGHNYLDKSTFVQIVLSSPSKSVRSPVQWYLDESLFSSSKLTVSLKSAQRRAITELIPHTISLPIMDDAESFTFQIDEVDTIFLEFEIYPTFGSKVIAKGVALPNMFKDASSSRIDGRQCLVPLFDPRLQPIGHVSFEFTIIRPFAGVHFDIHSRIETYWKSTQTLDSSSRTASQHLVTESSLSGEYLWVPVQITNDHVAFISSEWYIPVENVTLGVMDVTSDQLSRICKPQQSGLVEKLRSARTPAELRSILSSAIVKLGDFLENIHPDINLQIQIMFPSAEERSHLGLKFSLDINVAVDSVLSTVFSVSDRRKAANPNMQPRSLFFSSCNATICTAMNWKQPNYPVFLASHAGLSSPTVADASGTYISPHGLSLSRRGEEATSIKEAVKFSRTNNLLGMIIDADIALHAPALITTIKESGLVLITHGSANELRQNVDTQAAHGADGIFLDGVCSFLHGIET